MDYILRGFKPGTNYLKDSNHGLIYRKNSIQGLGRFRKYTKKPLPEKIQRDLFKQLRFKLSTNSHTQKIVE